MPVPSSDTTPAPEDVALLPAVGACVGFIAGAMGYGASRFCSPRVGAAAALSVPIVLTGALHLDGFLDVCDAAFASVDLERRHEIMRDPRHGSFAFAGGAIVVVTSYAAIREIDPRDWPSALALSAGVARFSALLTARSTGASGDRGTASRAFATPPSDRALLIAGVTLLLCAQLYGGPRLAGQTLAIATATMPIGRTLARRFGGTLSGDCYGFTITLGYVAMLCACA